MITLRDARYCNLKLFLIILVIYGHLIEPNIWQSQFLMIQYRWIYLFHMPLFTFLSGLFVNNASSCSKQLLKTLPLYAMLQLSVVILSNGKLKLWIPCWHLWYLLSFSFWTAIGWLWYHFFRERCKFLVLIASILIGCTVGMIPFIGREYSLSRTLVFFPYFWLGLLCDPKYNWSKLRQISLLGSVVVIVIMLNGGNKISTNFLYHAEPYAALKNGIILRLTCYLLGILLCLFLLSFTPAKRFSFTRAGANTMPAYLIHAPVVLWLRELNVPWILCPLIIFLFLYVLFKITQWHSKMYGIVPSERRDGRCLLFKISTKNTPSRSTVSCYP